LKDLFLVTTAIEESLPDNGLKTIFLGKWCKSLYESKNFMHHDFLIQDYIWDSRQRIPKDYLYISNVYEFFLEELTQILNNYHEVEHKKRFWRILVGMWLGWFIQISYERWLSILSLEQREESIHTKIIDYKEDEFLPNDMLSFYNQIYEDRFNHYLFSEIIKFRKKFSFEEVPDEGIEQVREEIYSQNNVFKRIIRGLQNRFSFKSQRYFFINSGMQKFNLLVFQILLGQMPYFAESKDLELTKINKDRSSFKMNFDSEDNFIKFLQTQIEDLMPLAYLEGFKELSRRSEEVNWPKNPKSIWTSNSFFLNEIFKYWSAEKLESEEAKLIISQHGGLYGTSKWYFFEEHEREISDVYFSWGWSRDKKTVPYPVKGFRRGIPKVNQNRNLFLVQMKIPRYSYQMFSGPISGQYLNYLENQFNFVEELSDEVRSNTTIRFKKNPYGWSEDQIWLRRFSDINVDLGESNILDCIKNSRIYVCTYNATTFLESFFLNHPTIIFWDQEFFELNDEAKTYFKGLKKINLFFDDPVKAANFINSIWHDVDSWWEEVINQKEYKEFRETFCRMPVNLGIRDLIKLKKHFLKELKED